MALVSRPRRNGDKFRASRMSSASAQPSRGPCRCGGRSHGREAAHSPRASPRLQHGKRVDRAGARWTNLPAGRDRCAWPPIAGGDFPTGTSVRSGSTSSRSRTPRTALPPSAARTIRSRAFAIEGGRVVEMDGVAGGRFRHDRPLHRPLSHRPGGRAGGDGDPLPADRAHAGRHERAAHRADAPRARA